VLILLRIAFRNVIANRKRSFLIGLVIFISSFIMLASNALMNGAEKQILKGYYNLQAADVVVVWEALHKVSASDTTRLLFLRNNTFDPEQQAANAAATDALQAFMTARQADVSHYFRVIRRNATLMVGKEADTLFSIYGLSPENRDLLLESKTIIMKEGSLLSDRETAISVSQSKADEYELAVGDKVTVEGLTKDGDLVSQEFAVAGIYEDGAGWDNYYGFISDKAARDLFEYEPDQFDMAKIYLKAQATAGAFADELDEHLTADSQVLRAESADEASQSYPRMAQSLKAVFDVFVFALLFIIAIGVRSTIKMALFERMKEFGTLRAIGYSRAQTFLIIFFDTFFLAVIALGAALVVALVPVMFLGKVGIYVGNGPLSYFGGERLYPSLQTLDVVFALTIIGVFTLLSTLSPGLQLCYQNITDILVKRQRRVSVMATMTRDLFRRSSPSGN
jgi:putative ABC transport system permease protein